MRKRSAVEPKVYKVRSLNEPDPKKIARFFVDCAIALRLIEDPAEEAEKTRALLAKIQEEKDAPTI